MSRASDDQALNRLTNFRDAYVRFINARNANRSSEAWLAQQEMARLATAAVRDVDRINLAPVILRDALAIGGRERPMNVIAVALHPELAEEYHVNPSMLVVMLETAIGEYVHRVQDSSLDFPNPLSTMRLAGLLSGARFTQAWLRWTVRVGGLVVMVIGLVASMHQLGWLQSLQSTLSNWGIGIP